MYIYIYVCIYTYIYVYTHTHTSRETYAYISKSMYRYGVTTINRLLKIVGLFCKRALQKRPIFSKETYNFKARTNRTHP